MIRDWKDFMKIFVFLSGLIVLMRACTFGPKMDVPSVDILSAQALLLWNLCVQGGYSIRAILIPLEMSTTASDDVLVRLCLTSICFGGGGSS